MSDWVHYEKELPWPIRPAKRFLHVAEAYFSSAPVRPPAELDADVLAWLFHDAPVSGWRSYEGATSVVDLRAAPEEIFASFSRGNRNNIKLATKRDQTETHFRLHPSDEDLQEFFDLYDEFAASKSIPRVGRAQLSALLASGKLALSTARSPQGDILAAHAYVLSAGRARLTHSASLFRLEADSSARGRIGRANRLLHWEDLLVLHEAAVGLYDLGGWYRGTSDEALLKINSFKREFGGRIVREWSSFRAASAIGSLYLTARDLNFRVRARS